MWAQFFCPVLNQTTTNTMYFRVGLNKTSVPKSPEIRFSIEYLSGKGIEDLSYFLHLKCMYTLPRKILKSTSILNSIRFSGFFHRKKQNKTVRFYSQFSLSRPVLWFEIFMIFKSTVTWSQKAIWSLRLNRH